MVFLLKEKNNIAKDKFDGNKFEKIRSLLTKVKYVAKNVIYLKGWSNKDLPKKNNIRFEERINFSFKNYVVKIVKEPHPLVLKSKELRYKSFFKPEKKFKIDSDEFDQSCEHLVVIDKSISEDFVVGSYRLLLKPKNKKKINFYSESEFDLSKLLKNKNLSLLEAGRSCVHENTGTEEL